MKTEILTILLKRARISKAALAEALDMSTPTLAKKLSGDHAQFTGLELDKLAKKLHLSKEQVFEVLLEIPLETVPETDPKKK